MIFKESVVKVADNSGAKSVKCIKTPLGNVAREGDIIVVSVKQVYSSKKVQKGKIYKAIIVQSKVGTNRVFGYKIFFRSNRVVLLKKGENKKLDYVLVGTRISKFVSYCIRKKGYSRLLLVSPGYI